MQPSGGFWGRNRIAIALVSALLLGAALAMWLRRAPKKKPPYALASSTNVASNMALDSIRARIAGHETAARPDVHRPMKVASIGGRTTPVPPKAVAVSPPPSPSRTVDLDLPWRRLGLCGDGAGAGREAARARYLQDFVSVAAWETTVHVHPLVPERVAADVESELKVVHRYVGQRLGLTTRPPAIYLYPGVEALREHSCVSANADAYYDGAIHLALAATRLPHRLRSTLTHEYVHHMLVSNGIGKPIWFQEGTAMLLANDRPQDAWRVWRTTPIVLEHMVHTFPTAAPPDRGALFYVHAYVMTEFLERLCLARSRCGVAELANALKSGAATPDELFDWAISRRGPDLFHTTPLPLWVDYAARGNFSERTLAALLSRKPSSRP